MFHKINVFIFSIVFLTAIFFPILSFADSSKFYQISLNYDKGNVTLKNIIVLPGDISRVNPGGNYKVELFSLSNVSLYKTNFDIPTSIHGEEFDYATGKVTGKEITVDNVDIVINVLYFPNGKEISVYDFENKKILTIPVQHFAEITPSPTSVFNPTLAKDNGGNILLYIGLGALGFGAGYAVYLFLKSRRKDNQL